MAEFSASDAAFSGFRISWEHPVALAVWAVLAFVISLVYSLFLSVSAGPAFADLQAHGMPPANSPEALTLVRELLPTYAALLIGLLVIYAVLYAAMNRVVLRPTESRFGYLRLAADELRQLGLFALMTVGIILIEIAIMIIAGLLISVLGLAIGQAGVLVGTAVFLVAAAGAFVFLGVRFSLASPLTFASGRIDLIGSWRLTRGRFWPLLGTYLIAFALSLVVMALSLAIAVAAGALVSIALGQPTLSSAVSVAEILSPATLVRMAFSAVGSALIWPITMSPPAVIYRALTGAGASATGRLFD